MTRLPDWPLRLNNWMEAQRSLPFSWKTNDCCSAAAAWVHSATGVDVFAVYAERYAPSMTSAMRIVKKAKGLKPLVEAALGDAIPPAYAQRGDVVLIEVEGRESVGVCLGGVAAGPGADGLVFLPMGEATCAWRV